MTLRDFKIAASRIQLRIGTSKTEIENMTHVIMDIDFHAAGTYQKLVYECCDFKHYEASSTFMVPDWVKDGDIYILDAYNDKLIIYIHVDEIGEIEVYNA